MEEGQLKKEIKLALESTILWADLHGDRSPEDEINKVVDDAKKEFPEAAMGMKWTDFEKQLQEWFKKWFGEVKKE